MPQSIDISDRQVQKLPDETYVSQAPVHLLHDNRESMKADNRDEKPNTAWPPHPYHRMLCSSWIQRLPA